MNHTVGLPTKDGAEKPMFDYEKILYDALLTPGYLNSNPKSLTNDVGTVACPFKQKHLWVKKWIKEEENKA